MADRTSSTTPVVLIIRDGWGQNPNPEHRKFNAITLAKTPFDEKLRREWPSTLIRTCGEDVGLPLGVMGNSEVGHQNIGAGRIVNQELLRIRQAIHEGSFFENPALGEAIEHAKKNNRALHLMGLVSDGQVHSDLEHLLALIDMAAHVDFPPDRLFLHAFTDGRDTSPFTGKEFLHRVQRHMKTKGLGRIASICGRYFAMDRDHRWQRVAQAYRCLTGKNVEHPLLNDHDGGCKSSPDADLVIQRYYDEPSDENCRGDEFILPTQIVDEDGRPIGLIQDDDAVIFFNYRGDRPRELTKAFVYDDDAWSQVEHDGFNRGAGLQGLHFCCMCEYEHGLPVSSIAFPKPPRMKGSLGEVVSEAHLTQFRCAETEKFPHITFFFNDYQEEPFAGETRRLVPSPRDVTTYDQKPEMSAVGICDEVLARLESQDCESLFVVNFANPDMVGHTGVLHAVIKAVETVDACVGRIVEATLARGGALIITADHGNAEQMWKPEDKSPHTAHTTFDVPLLVVGEARRNHSLRKDGRLADIAPTILDLMGIDAPPQMTGHSLIMPMADSPED